MLLNKENSNKENQKEESQESDSEEENTENILNFGESSQDIEKKAID